MERWYTLWLLNVHPETTCKERKKKIYWWGRPVRYSRSRWAARSTETLAQLSPLGLGTFYPSIDGAFLFLHTRKWLSSIFRTTFTPAPPVLHANHMVVFEPARWARLPLTQSIYPTLPPLGGLKGHGRRGWVRTPVTKVSRRLGLLLPCPRQGLVRSLAAGTAISHASAD